jgi:hypothetical protein
MKKLSYGLLAGMVIAGSATLGGASTANAEPRADGIRSGSASVRAWPTGCTNGKFDNGWSAKCTHSNGGSYRATVICQPYGGGDKVWRDANVWRTSGISRVFCPPLTQVLSGGIESRASR